MVQSLFILNPKFQASSGWMQDLVGLLLCSKPNFNPFGHCAALMLYVCISVCLYYVLFTPSVYGLSLNSIKFCSVQKFQAPSQSTVTEQPVCVKPGQKPQR